MAELEDTMTPEEFVHWASYFNHQSDEIKKASKKK